MGSHRCITLYVTCAHKSKIYIILPDVKYDMSDSDVLAEDVELSRINVNFWLYMVVNVDNIDQG